MTHSLKLALAQVAGTHVPEDNLALARNLVAEASAQGSGIIVFPEMFMGLPRKWGSPADLAEPVDGHFAESLGKLAEEYNLYIIAGLWEKVPETSLVRNAVIMLSPEGKTITVYRKLHLFDALSIRESDTMLPGNELPAISEIKGFNVGLAICYDLRFPELFRDLAHRGADLVIIPSAWYAGLIKEDHWLTLLRARAIENTFYVAGVNLTGPIFCGRSSVFDPFGILKAGAGEGPELLIVKIDSERLNEVRSKLPTLKHCRPELFQEYSS